MATLYMPVETDSYNMSYIIVTEKNNCVIVDGGRPSDMQPLKEYIAGRHISAWILTHAHRDHVSGFVEEMRTNGGKDFDIEKIYYNFPDYKTWVANHDVPAYEYYKSDLDEILPEFEEVEHVFQDKAHIVQQGETLDIDEVHIDFLFTVHEGVVTNPINDSSTVFRVQTPNTSVMFLGDLGPEAGDLLFREARGKLKSDICQMAHHGHMNVSMEVYAEILPKTCLWSAPDWLYAEEELPWWLDKTQELFQVGRIRMYGTGMTRKWMDMLGAEKHYVSGIDGPHQISL